MSDGRAAGSARLSGAGSAEGRGHGRRAAAAARRCSARPATGKPGPQTRIEPVGLDEAPRPGAFGAAAARRAPRGLRLCCPADACGRVRTRMMERRLDPERLGDHVDRLYRAAWALCGSREDAEDLVQETFARVLARPRFLRRDDDIGYLLGALRKTFLSTKRTERRRPRTEVLPEDREPPEPRATGDPVAALEASEVFAAVARAPRRLSGRHRRGRRRGPRLRGGGGGARHSVRHRHEPALPRARPGRAADRGLVAPACARLRTAPSPCRARPRARRACRAPRRSR